MAKLRLVDVMGQVVNVLAALVVLAGAFEEPARIEDNPLARLNDELTGPELTYDHQAWRAVELSDSGPINPNVNENWKQEEAQPEPPRRRRPGRKRKRRPQLPPPSAVDGSAPDVQDGVRFNIESGIRVVYDNSENERPRQRRPQRIQDDQHWRGEAVNEDRPIRRRGHRRRQRPYIPDLGIEPSGNAEPTSPIKLETNLRTNVKDENQVRVVEDGYKVSSYAEENSGRNVDKGHEQMKERMQNEEVELTTTDVDEDRTIEFDHPNKEEIIQNDKSYRRPYSQAKKQESEEAEMIGGSADLKALLKQSGGLSLSEVLQQRNLSLADLLTGKQYALSALKSTENQQPNKNPSENDETNIEPTNEDNVNVENSDVDKRRRRLPPTNKENHPVQRRIKPNSDDKTPKIRENTSPERVETNRRRLPPTNTYRRQKPKIKEDNDEPKETTTEKIAFTPNHPRKSLNENIIKTKEDIEENLESEIISNTKNIIEDETDIVVTTEEIITTTKKPKTEEIRNRLSLKPRLRLPSIKTVPKRMTVPRKNATEKIKDNIIIPIQETSKKAPIPNQAFQINLKDMFGMSEIVSVAKVVNKIKPVEKKENISTTTSTTTEKPRTTSSYKAITRSTTEASVATSTLKSTTQIGKINAKDEILEVLTDIKGGENLKNILAERNMTLKELVEHRERGSSQVHLADIFHNASREPDPAEPFLAKSLIEPISKQIYPLKALLEGNMRESTNSISRTKKQDNSGTPPMFVDFAKTSQNEENLGIVTLFDKFSEFVGHPKVFDAKDVKKDSDGSSYFTSVISVKPTDEVYRESRSESGFHNSHKQMSEIFSSIPTYIKTEDIIDAKVVQDWSLAHRDQNVYPNNNQINITVIPDNHIPSYVHKDVDGDGLIVLDDLQRLEELDNHIAQASNQEVDDDQIHQNVFDNYEPNFYSKLPVGVRSAIIVSSAIVGISLVVFLTIFVACRWRQKRRNVLRYEDSFNTSRVRSPILDGSRKGNKNNSSSRSISPILVNGETAYRNQKINTMDSQTQRDAQDYLWDSLRKPFQ